MKITAATLCQSTMDVAVLAGVAACGLGLALWPIATMEAMATCFFLCPRTRGALQRHVTEHRRLLRGEETRECPNVRDQHTHKGGAPADPGVPVRRVVGEVLSRMQVRLVMGAVVANLALQVRGACVE